MMMMTMIKIIKKGESQGKGRGGRIEQDNWVSELEFMRSIFLSLVHQGIVFRVIPKAMCETTGHTEKHSRFGWSMDFGKEGIIYLLQDVVSL